MINRFLEKTRDGVFTVGTFFEFGGDAAAELIGMSCLDYFIIDCEHGPYDIESAAGIIRASEGMGNCRVTPFARSKDSSRSSILKLLDIGAKGVIIPNVQSYDEACRIVEYGKYSPVGNRGVAASRSVCYGLDGSTSDLKSWFSECNEKQLLIPQCETLGCLKDIERISALNGIDGIFIGPYDLSTAMGIPGKFDDKDFLGALKRIVSAAKNCGKFVICYADTVDAAAARCSMGLSSITMGFDFTCYLDGINNMVRGIRGVSGL